MLIQERNDNGIGIVKMVIQNRKVRNQKSTLRNGLLFLELHDSHSTISSTCRPFSATAHVSKIRTKVYASPPHSAFVALPNASFKRINFKPSHFQQCGLVDFICMLHVKLLFIYNRLKKKKSSFLFQICTAIVIINNIWPLRRIFSF